MKKSLVILLIFQICLIRQISNSESGSYKYADGYVKGEGSSHFDAYNSAHGEKSDKIYKSNHYHNKGLKEAFEKGSDHAGYSKSSGEKKFVLEPKHGSSATKKGAEYGVSDKYKNNHKKAGYGEVFGSDQNKNNKQFYDKANKKGHYNKYGNARSYFDKSEQAQRSGGGGGGAGKQFQHHSVIKR